MERDNKGRFIKGHKGYRIKHSIDTILKISKKQIGKPCPQRARFGHPVSERTREKIRKAKLGTHSDKRIHAEMTMREMGEFEKQGFKCIPLVRTNPDFIAMKDGKIYAVEVHIAQTRPNFNKYNGITWFDDIIWILQKRLNSKYFKGFAPKRIMKQSEELGR